MEFDTPIIDTNDESCSGKKFTFVSKRINLELEFLREWRNVGTLGIESAEAGSSSGRRIF